MAALVKIKSLLSPLTIKQCGVTYNAVRTKVTTDFDFMPGPRPKNEKERLKAAKKYGLHPDEYKPYPDDGMHPFGDYPELPMIGVGLRDPNYPYDYPDERRNFGEVIHAQINIMGEDRADYGEKPVVGYWTAPLVFGGLVLGGFMVYRLLEPRPRYLPLMEKQMYKPGVRHYTFEPK